MVDWRASSSPKATLPVYLAFWNSLRTLGTHDLFKSKLKK